MPCYIGFQCACIAPGFSVAYVIIAIRLYTLHTSFGIFLCIFTSFRTRGKYWLYSIILEVVFLILEVWRITSLSENYNLYVFTLELYFSRDVLSAKYNIPTFFALYSLWISMSRMLIKGNTKLWFDSEVISIVNNAMLVIKSLSRQGWQQIKIFWEQLNNF